MNTKRKRVVCGLPCLACAVCLCAKSEELEYVDGKSFATTAYVAGQVSTAGEEILASLLGAMVCDTFTDRDALVAKATAELLDCGVTLDVATQRLQELWDLMEALLGWDRRR